MNNTTQRQIFSIRKYAAGAASVLIGASLLAGGVAQADEVETVTSEPAAEVVSQPVAEVAETPVVATATSDQANSQPVATEVEMPATNTQTADNAPTSSQEAADTTLDTPVVNNATDTQNGTEGILEPSDDTVAETGTTVTKEGDTITVTNPEVKVEFPNGKGKYSANQVTYENVTIPDDITISEGDKVVFTLPTEMGLQTSYTFDVTNPEGQVIGSATADAQTSKITVTFNDYFATHPLNKSMSLSLDTRWTDVVSPGEQVKLNFNGTIVDVTIDQEQEIGKDELISKWGSQDKDDPTVINWTIRVNYARRVLNYVTIIDQMSDNQQLVDDYFVMNYVDSVTPWLDKGSALDLIKTMSTNEHGWTITMDRLDRMVYIWYKTRLTSAVKDSTNPTNNVTITAEDTGAISSSKVQLVGGRGDAKGDDVPKPTPVPPTPTPEPPAPTPTPEPEPEEPDTPVNPDPEKPEEPTEPKEKPSEPAKPAETKVSYGKAFEPVTDKPAESYQAALPATGEDPASIILTTVGALGILSALALAGYAKWGAYKGDHGEKGHK